MAKTYSDIQNSAYKVGNIMDWTNALTRLSGVPVDITEVYDSFDTAVVYAATNPVAYEGQILAVTENGDTDVYVITPASQGTKEIDGVETTIYLKKVGTVPVGDGQSIEVVDGAIKVYGFNDCYYAYSTAEDGTSTYTKTDGFKEGLEPRIVKRTNDEGSVVTDESGNPVYEIAWYEPSTTTVEGLSSTVDTLSKEVAGKADKTTTLAGYGITDAYTKEEVDSKVSSVYKYKGSVATYDALPTDGLTIGDVYNVEAADEDNDVKAGDNVAWNGTGWDILGGVVDLTGYALKTDLDNKVDKNGTDRLITEDEVAIIEKLANLTGSEQVNVIDGVSDEFVISDDGKVLSVKAIEQTKITGLADALAGKVDAVNGSRLITADEGDALADLLAGEYVTVSNFAEELAKKVDAAEGYRLISDDEAAIIANVANAQENVLEAIMLNGTALEITDKAVNIPVGGESLGVVKSATGDNKVSIAADGTMSVGTVNVNSLAQTDGDTLILNGGSAAN